MKHSPDKDRDRCPYLSSIDRSVLDFDYEKICSITLKEEHIYCCLVCGMNFQGKGKDSVAYRHSLEMSHHLFIGLSDSDIICLPDDYEVKEHSLEDIKGYLHPRYDEKCMLTLYTPSRTFDGVEFHPGFIGLSNFGNNDSLNSIILVLTQITHFRNLCLSYKLYDKEIENRISDPLLFSIIEAIQKIFNQNNLKGKFSPYSLVKIVEIKSQGRFPFSKTASTGNSVSSNSDIFKNSAIQDTPLIDPMALLTWIIHHLKKRIDKYLRDFQLQFLPESEAIHKTSNNVLTACIQGELCSRTYKASKTTSSQSSDPIKTKKQTKKSEPNKVEGSLLFNCISLNLPSIIEATLGTSTKDHSDDSRFVSQIPIYQLLDLKFLHSSKSPLIWKSPYYLFIHFTRFSKSSMNIEKNKTLVSFPLIDLDLAPYMHPDSISLNPITKYNLIANISFKGSLKNGKFLTQLLHPIKNEWFEIEDSNVQIVLPQAILLNEAYILMYKRSDIQ
ncbi:putative ubiquitin specific protease 39 isoform 2 [Cryptosporidium felis]|nr:putative ubiquitin specific protease 39 isoform 2 [Cryptosporidium felis]